MKHNRKKSRKVKGGNALGCSSGIGYIILGLTIVVCLFVMGYIVPELTPEDPVQLNISDLEADDLIIVSAERVKYDTKVYRQDAHSGDINTHKSQDLPTDIAVLARVADVAVSPDRTFDVHRERECDVFQDSGIVRQFRIPTYKAAKLALRGGLGSSLL